MRSILDSIKSMLVPIRREGWPFIAGLVFLALFFGWFWSPIVWIGLILAAWCTYFFRDPKRVTPVDPDLVVSPADGRIAAVATGVAPRELGLGEQTRRRVSVFMSVFDCHVNRAPLAAQDRPDRLHARENSSTPSSTRRARATSGTASFSTAAHGPVGVVQIAGLVARRIVCFRQEGDALSPGERIGLIRFGCRVDVYLPLSAHVLVAEGQTMIAGETVIARFDDPEAPECQVRVD